MGWFDQLLATRKRTASTAKERLQIIIAHERNERSRPEYFERLQRDILEVIKKYVQVTDDQVRLSIERSGDYEVLELNITLPETHGELAAEAVKVN